MEEKSGNSMDTTGSPEPPETLAGCFKYLKNAITSSQTTITAQLNDYTRKLDTRVEKIEDEVEEISAAVDENRSYIVRNAKRTRENNNRILELERNERRNTACLHGHGLSFDKLRDPKQREAVLNHLYDVALKLTESEKATVVVAKHFARVPRNPKPGQNPPPITLVFGMNEGLHYMRHTIKHARRLSEWKSSGGTPEYRLKANLVYEDQKKRDWSYAVRLTGGSTHLEGNVEIYFRNEWGSVCDDDWSIEDATVVCKQLGFKDGALRRTTDSYFGHTRVQVWLDNVVCTGHEKELADCKSNGWGLHDCTRQEAAGVICVKPPEPTTVRPSEFDKNDLGNKVPISVLFNTIGKISLQISGGRTFKEGRVQVQVPKSTFFAVFCADRWTLREAAVVCHQLGLHYAQQAVKTGYFGSAPKDNLLITGVYCTGDESHIGECVAYPFEKNMTCKNMLELAGVVCNDDLPDLTPDAELIESSVYLHDQAMFYLQCAMEENCLSKSAYDLVAKSPGNWHYNVRRLLRFSTRVRNVGTADFRPDTPKDNWEWHQCHMHHHSMETFSKYDIFDAGTMEKVAEGHKASFCLEDSECHYGNQKFYNCRNFGDQGISVGCWDQYLHDIDCQWIDITDVKPGQYKLKITVNPEYRVAETNYTNNAAICDLYYNLMQVYASNCQLTKI